MSQALYVGRFQPFHLGHLNALKWILERHDTVIIGIGSAQYSYTFRNPFTLGERLEMIWRVLKSRGLLDRCIICAIPDTDSRHSLWVSQVRMYSPRFDVVYTNDPLSIMLFEDAGIPVRPIPYFEREKYSATKIRELIAMKKAWRSLVPKEVAEYIEAIGGVERIRGLWLIRNSRK